MLMNKVCTMMTIIIIVVIIARWDNGNVTCDDGNMINIPLTMTVIIRKKNEKIFLLKLHYVRECSFNRYKERKRKSQSEEMMVEEVTKKREKQRLRGMEQKYGRLSKRMERSSSHTHIHRITGS